MIILFLGFDVFAFTHLAKYAKLLAIGTGGLGFVLFAYFFKQYPKSLRSFGLLFLGVLFLSILTAQQLHHQSILSGIIANSAIPVIGLSFITYYLLIKYSIPLEKLKQSILKASWILLFVFFLLFISGYSFRPSSDDELSLGYASLMKGLLNLGAVIYLTYFFKKDHFKYLLLSLILFSANHWADLQRFVLFTFLVAFTILLFNFRNRNVGLKIIALGLIVLPLLTTVLASTKFGQTFSSKFLSAFELLDPTKSEIEESSVAARISQIHYAWENIQEHPLTGIGKIRSSEKTEAIGLDYFHVSDIGVIGIWFSFGLLGILIYFKQIQTLLRNTLKRRLFFHHSYAEFIVFLTFLVVQSFLTGRSVHAPAEFMLTLAFIEFGKYTSTENAHDDA